MVAVKRFYDIETGREYLEGDIYPAEGTKATEKNINMLKSLKMLEDSEINTEKEEIIEDELEEDIPEEDETEEEEPEIVEPKKEKRTRNRKRK